MAAARKGTVRRSLAFSNVFAYFFGDVKSKCPAGTGDIKLVGPEKRKWKQTLANKN